jgi:hypothetical protein
MITIADSASAKRKRRSIMGSRDSGCGRWTRANSQRIVQTIGQRIVHVAIREQDRIHPDEMDDIEQSAEPRANCRATHRSG